MLPPLSLKYYNLFDLCWGRWRRIWKNLRWIYKFNGDITV